MAALSAGIRLAVRAYWSSLLSGRREQFALTKAELDAAIAATDNWIDTNAASYNTALPLAARTKLSAGQKAELFSIVALRRYTG